MKRLCNYCACDISDRRSDATICPSVECRRAYGRAKYHVYLQDPARNERRNENARKSRDRCRDKINEASRQTYWRDPERARAFSRNHVHVLRAKAAQLDRILAMSPAEFIAYKLQLELNGEEENALA
jgi:hypothetical protein